MALTDPDNIWTPDSGDDYALTVDLAAMADTIQTVLTDIHGEELDTGWVPFGAFNSGWTQTPSTISPGYRVLNKVLYLRGRVSGTLSSGSVIFNTVLPAFARPSYTHEILVSGTDALVYNGSINASGQVTVAHGTTANDILLSSFGGVPVG